MAALTLGRYRNPAERRNGTLEDGAACPGSGALRLWSKGYGGSTAPNALMTRRITCGTSSVDRLPVTPPRALQTG